MTELLSIDRLHPQPDRLERARQVLDSGGLVIVPTETVYGIACDPAVPGALERLAAAKGRDDSKPIARLAGRAEQVADAALDWNRGIQRLAERYWPGPLTMVLDTSGGWTGFRVPDHAVALALADTCGRLLALTSANRSGEPDARTAQDAVSAVDADLALDSGPSAAAAVPSTVIRADGSNIECLREGRIPFSEVEWIYKHQDNRNPKK